MRISDWSSDVCSSDLSEPAATSAGPASGPEPMPRLDDTRAQDAFEQRGAASSTVQDLGGLSGEVRVSGDKLDSLLAMTGELHVARMRGQLQSNDIDHLKSFVQAWREDWTDRKSTRLNSSQ